jgi:ATP-binding protein involved in chromosome partitioning
MITVADVRERLTEIRPLGSPRNIIDAGMVKRIDLREGQVVIGLELPAMPAQTSNLLVTDIRRAVGALEGVRAVHVHHETAAAPGAAHSPYGDLGPLPGVRHIVAVSSAKGGVGKSTVAANLALALHRIGKRVGLMDSDVYGPSLPILFGLSGRPPMADDKRIVPLQKYGLQLMSVGFFVDENTPVIWRGPMVMGLVRQFLKDVAWTDLDVLIVDMPPGTGDAQLTLVQQVPLAGGIVVTTPQEVATLDVGRGVAMFRQVNTPVLGIVENMSAYACPHCGHEEDIFGSGGAARLAAELGIPLLGQIPLLGEICRDGDAGTPIVVASPEHPVSHTFLDIAAAVLTAVEAQSQGTQAPLIVG